MLECFLNIMLLIAPQEALKVPRPPSHGGCVAQITPEFALQWHLLAVSHGVHVDIERHLYQTKDSNRYYIHVRIKNDNDITVSVDLRDAHSSIFPNQLYLAQLSPPVMRGPVDEQRQIIRPLDPDREQALIDAHWSHKLSEIEPHQEFDFYRESRLPLDNAGGFEDGCYLIVSLDGRLLLTDGQMAWQVDTHHLSSTLNNGVIFPWEMVFPLPITFLPVPESVKVIRATPTL